MLKKSRRIKWKLQCPDYLLVLLTVFFCMLWEEKFFLGSGLNKYFQIWNRLLFDVLELLNRTNVYEGEERRMSKRRMWLGN